MSVQSADRWFFPAATLFGALAVPAFVFGLQGRWPALPGLASIAGHAHEMLFGYALAVIAGFLATRVTARRAGLLLGLWLGARATFILFPFGLATAAFNIAFAALVAATVAPPLIRAAKKPRNRLLGPLTVAICLALVGAQLVRLAGAELWLAHLLRQSVLLIALLLALMGGRIIAPAVAGAIERRGGRLEARVQPRLEAWLLLLLLLAVLAALLPGTGLLVGAALVAAGVLVLVRLLRWRLWLLRGRPDLVCLAAGYAWLGFGLCLLGAGWGFELLAVSAATHAITVGALGTLTATVMARISFLRAKREPVEARLLPLVVLLLSVAAVLRVFFSAQADALAISAACWSAALLLLMPLLLQRRRP